MSLDLELTRRRALVTAGTKGASPRAGAITGTEYVIDGGTVPTA